MGSKQIACNFASPFRNATQVDIPFGLFRIDLVSPETKTFCDSPRATHSLSFTAIEHFASFCFCSQITQTKCISFSIPIKTENVWAGRCLIASHCVRAFVVTHSATSAASVQSTTNEHTHTHTKTEANGILCQLAQGMSASIVNSEQWTWNEKMNIKNQLAVGPNPKFYNRK